MSKRRRVEVRAVVTAVTLGAFVFVAVLFVLSAIAHPPGLKTSVADASSKADRLEAHLQSPGDPFAYAAGALCRDRPDAAVVALKARVNAAASAGGVAVTDVGATPGGGDASHGGLIPIAVQFDATGRYDSVVGMLDALAKSQPRIFVDTVDLKSQTSSVALKFSGRIYCSPVSL